MSCRLIRDDSPQPVEPLFASSAAPRVPGSVPAPWNPATAAGDAAAASGSEIRRLQARIHDLEQQLERSVADARANALREGEAKGCEKAASATQPVLDKLVGAIAGLGALRARMREEAEADLVQLSLAIARRILRRELTVDPEAIQGLVRAALDRMQIRDITHIRLYPGHEDVVRRCLTAYHAGGIELVCDPAMGPGDFVIETKRGNLEASMETQLAEIERGFADRIAR